MEAIHDRQLGLFGRSIALGDMLSTLRQRLVTLLNVKDENASFGSLLRQVMSTWDHPNLQQIFQKSWKSLDNTTIELQIKDEYDAYIKQRNHLAHHKGRPCCLQQDDAG